MKLPIALFAAALLAPGLASAQTPPAAPPAGPQNLIINGSFEQFFQVDNLWDGVDSNGFLAGARGSARAITERGTVENLAMPLAVQAADMNGDGLVDIITSDLDGYLRIYFNSGTAQEPKFTHAEIIPVYLSRFNWSNQAFQTYRHTWKIGVVNNAPNQPKDIILGNYGGEVAYLKNFGSVAAPDFRQPKEVDEIIINTSRDGKLWGNLFAPIVYDWDGDGKPDLLIGEGSYSANAVHLLLNQGTPAAPRFALEHRHYLAYGDGREQLAPAVVDFNGDGNPDLLVGDRKGTINVYLSNGKWTKGSELKFSSELSFGRSRLTGAVYPAVADFNGDGLFDIIVGKTNGRIGLALNTGTKEQPKFDALTDIKGVDVWNRTTTRSPSDWSIDFGLYRGNLYGYTTVVRDEEDQGALPIPHGKSVLKVGYLQPLNKVVRYNQLLIPPSRDNRIARELSLPPNTMFNPARTWWWQPWPAHLASVNWDTNVVIIRKVLDGSSKRNEIRPGVDYNLSFSHRGQGVQRASWTISYGGYAQGRDPKVKSRDARGAVVMEWDRHHENIVVEGNFNVGGMWGQMTRPVSFRFQKFRDLNDPEKREWHQKPAYRAVLEIRATLAPGSGVFYLDNVELVERK